MKVNQLIKDSIWLPPRYGDDFKPVVSVLLPTYRRCQSGMLARCIESVLSQTFVNFELIVVDDASTDGSYDLVQHYRDKDMRVGCIRHAQNIGLPALSIFEAYIQSKGRFIAFAFDDNEFYPDAIQSLLTECDVPDRSIVYGHVDYFLPAVNGRSIQEVKSFGFGDVSPCTLVSHNYIPNNAVLVRRSVFECAGWYDPHIVIARLCDWDLWRRVSKMYEIVPVDVSVGKEFGPVLADSLGSTYGMDVWAIEEFMRMPNRNSQLLPAHYGDYDVCHIPSNATARLSNIIQETMLLFSNKSWMTTTESQAEGKILIVYPSLDDSVSLYFEELPNLNSRLRVIQYTGWHWTEVVGAQAVIFIRDLYGMRPWIDRCKRLSIPCYFFLDENNFRLAEEYQELRAWKKYDVTAGLLQEFNGIFLNSKELFTFFSDHGLNKNLYYYPPVLPKREILRCASVDAVHTESESLTIAFIGGKYDRLSFISNVMPAIKRLSNHDKLKVVVVGINKSDLSRFHSDTLDIVYMSSSLNYSAMMMRLHQIGIDVLVCPDLSGNRGNEAHALLNGSLLRAAVIVANGDSHESIQDTICLRCSNGIDAWEKCLNIVLHDKDIRNELVLTNRDYCAKNFDGSANEKVLKDILKDHRYAGTLLSEERLLKIIKTDQDSQVPFFSSILSLCQKHFKKQLYGIISSSRRYEVLSRLYSRIRHVRGVWNIVLWLRSQK